MIRSKRVKLFLVMLAVAFIALAVFVVPRRNKGDKNRDQKKQNYIEKVYIAEGFAEEGTPVGEISTSIAEAERIIVAAKLKEPDLSGVAFKAKWYYEDLSKFEPFFEAHVKEATEKMYLVSILEAHGLPPKLDQFKVFGDLFPVGEYRVEWYSQGIFEQEIRFTISSQ